MAASSLALCREVNDLVLEQIFAFKQAANLDDRQLLEYHLRHLRILTLYRELDRVGLGTGEHQGLRPSSASLMASARAESFLY